VEPQNSIKVVIQLRCAGANLRHISNPLAQAGFLNPSVVLTMPDPSNVRRTFKLVKGTNKNRGVPGKIANSSALNKTAFDEQGFVMTCTSAQDKSCKDGAAKGYREVDARYGYITMNLPIDNKDLEDVWNATDGAIKLPEISLDIIQSLDKPNGGQYRGQAGQLKFNITRSGWDASGRQFSARITTYGEEGYCGGYHSPLILYFDNDRPMYTGVATFKLFGSPGPVYWPEAGSKAYFLALDRNHNGIIDERNELFGNLDSENYDNGFDRLAVLDANHDGVIDAKDPMFSKLVLWHDTKAKGKCIKKDLISLEKKGVVSISLKYDSITRPYGGRAQEKAEASFQFKDGSKNAQNEDLLKEGKVIDVWFRRPTVLSQR
jgi:hypothetical protein